MRKEEERDGENERGINLVRVTKREREKIKNERESERKDREDKLREKKRKDKE